jgi:hypothetical protein
LRSVGQGRVHDARGLARDRQDVRDFVGAEIAAADHHLGGSHQLLASGLRELEPHDVGADGTMEMRLGGGVERALLGLSPEAAGGR